MSLKYAQVYPTALNQFGVAVPDATSETGFVFEVKTAAQVLDILIPKYTLAERDALSTQPIGTLIRLIDSGANTIQSSDGAGGWD